MSMFHGSLRRVAVRLEPTHVLPNPFGLSEKRSFSRAVPSALCRNPKKSLAGQCLAGGDCVG